MWFARRVKIGSTGWGSRKEATDGVKEENGRLRRDGRKEGGEEEVREEVRMATNVLSRSIRSEKRMEDEGR